MILALGEGVPLARRAGGQQDGPHGRGLANAIGRHVTGDKLYRIVNTQAGADASPG